MTCRYKWSGQELINGTWQDAAPPSGGEVVSLGFQGMEEDETGEYAEVPYTTWGDYVGGTVERSNYRSLLADYPDTFIEVLSGYGGHNLLIHEGAITEELQEIFTDLLEQYPAYNDEDVSNLEHELAEESWDNWLQSDTMHGLESAGVETDGIDPEDLKMRYYSLTYEQNYGPECEDAVSAYFPFHDDVMKALVQHYTGK